MDTRPPEKRLRVVPFSIHATRGLLRDQGMRRKMMTFFLVVVLAFVVAGLTILRPWLDPHEHRWLFIAYWLVCAWQIVLVVLLALLDLLLIRAQARAAGKAIRHEHTDDIVSDAAGPDRE